MNLLIHDYAGHPFAVELSRTLARRGHRVVHAYAGNLVTPRGALDRRADDPEQFEIREVPMAKAYRKNKYSFVKRRRHEIAYGRQLARLLKAGRYDVVVSGNTPTEPQWRLVKTAREQGIALVSWVQDFYSLAVTKLARRKLGPLGSLAGWYYRRLDARCLRHSRAVVAITSDFVPRLTRFGVASDRITVIPNWAPLDELPVRPRRNPWSAEHGLDDRFVFLYSGTLAMKHNPDLLRQLAVRFRGDDAVRIVVVSEGPGAEFLRASKAAERLQNLQVLPYQPFSVMPEVLATADVLVTVLEADAGVFSVPSKVLTYHCAGRPILGAMPAENLATRIIREQSSGCCFAPDDMTGYLTAAGRLRHDQVFRETMGRAARNYAEREFDSVRITDRFEEVIRRAAGARR